MVMGTKFRMYCFEVDDFRCGGCNWTATQAYVLATSKKEAKELLDEGMGHVHLLYAGNAH